MFKIINIWAVWKFCIFGTKSVEGEIVQQNQFWNCSQRQWELHPFHNQLHWAILDLTEHSGFQGMISKDYSWTDVWSRCQKTSQDRCPGSSERHFREELRLANQIKLARVNAVCLETNIYPCWVHICLIKIWTHNQESCGSWGIFVVVIFLSVLKQRSLKTHNTFDLTSRSCYKCNQSKLVI